jgi:sulfatase maturation enzyme AslB (radical SAM superfamily)
LMKAGKTENDLWEQLQPHLDYVEQIYFSGGEPLIMDEHHWILDALEKRQRYNVEIRYNTNFTKIKLKDRSVFEYWKRFNNVKVGASLEASGKRGEYIRKDSDWSEIENNRRAMLEICPNTKFIVSATVSILNVWHLSDFHREWVEKGLIRPQDFQINLVQEPEYYRIDIATPEYKDLVKKKILQHCEWLMHFPETEEIYERYISTMSFMLATDNTQYIPEFWKKTKQLDQIRNESILEILPELTPLILKDTSQHEA